VHLIGMYLVGVYLMGMHLMGMHLMGVYLIKPSNMRFCLGNWHRRFRATKASSHLQLYSP
jgi:hypothetical protein